MSEPGSEKQPQSRHSPSAGLRLGRAGHPGVHLVPRLPTRKVLSRVQEGCWQARMGEGASWSPTQTAWVRGNPGWLADSSPHHPQRLPGQSRSEGKFHEAGLAVTHRLAASSPQQGSGPQQASAPLCGRQCPAAPPRARRRYYTANARRDARARRSGFQPARHTLGSGVLPLGLVSTTAQPKQNVVWTRSCHVAASGQSRDPSLPPLPYL